MTFLQYLYPLFILLFHPFSHVLGGHWNFMYTVKLYFAPYKKHLIINEFSLLPRTRGNNIKICAAFYGVFCHKNTHSYHVSLYVSICIHLSISLHITAEWEMARVLNTRNSKWVMYRLKFKDTRVNVTGNTRAFTKP